MKWSNANKPLEQMIADGSAKEAGRASPPVNPCHIGASAPAAPVGGDRPAVFKLPLPPTVNHYYATVRGRRVLSKDGRDYAKQVASILFVGKAKPFSARARLRIGVTISFSPRSKNSDLDNRIKALADSLQKSGLVPNDRQIDEWNVRRGPLSRYGFVEVTIFVLQEES
jgi:crossover junction endodeoxyribonuclease RusA